MDLITGATGFIGKRLMKRLKQAKHSCRSIARSESDTPFALSIDLDDKIGLARACTGIETVFHCAGHAHAFEELNDTDAEKHWKVNFEGTRNLVEAAGQSGVRSFVFLSSVKSMADPGIKCADEGFPGHPTSVYGQSKRAAEETILEAGRRYGMHVVNLRLAMVYGAGGKGNLERMGRLVRQGWFPPLPETGNHRSLVHVEDVVSAMCLVAVDSRAKGKTYIITGPESPSGRQLYDALRDALRLRRCRWSIPEVILRGAGRCGDQVEHLFKRRVSLDSEVVDRLLGSAWYSSALITRELGWLAKVSLQEGLREMLGVETLF